MEVRRPYPPLVRHSHTSLGKITSLPAESAFLKRQCVNSSQQALPSTASARMDFEERIRLARIGHG